jgi:hypothetical protein
MRLTVDGTAQYLIELQGELDPSWTAELGGLQVSYCPRTDGQPLTTLVGTVTDQAALAGILNLAFSLGLPVLSVISMGSGGCLPASGQSRPASGQSLPASGRCR